MTSPFDDPDQRPKSLARMEPPIAMPESLEDRVIRALAARGAFDRPRVARRRRALAVAAVMAACLTSFALGGLTSGRSVTSAGAAPGSKWMLLLYEDAAFVPPPVGQEATYVEEYRAWAATTRGQGLLLDGAELMEGGRLVGLDRTAAAGETADDVSSSRAGRLTGYFVIRAATLDEASAIAATCPHMRHGGRIAIKPMGAG